MDSDDKTGLYMFLGFFALPIMGLIVLVGPYALAGLAIAGGCWGAWKLAQGVGTGAKATGKLVIDQIEKRKEKKAWAKWQEEQRKQEEADKPPTIGEALSLEKGRWENMEEEFKKMAPGPLKSRLYAEMRNKHIAKMIRILRNEG